MADKRFEAKKPEEKEDWLLSYADMITLLLAFFIMLLSMSKFDAVKYEKVTSGLSKEVGGHDVVQPIEQLKSEVQSTVKGLKLDDNQVNVGSDDRGLVLDLDGGTFFEPGTAALKQEFIGPLVKIAQSLNSPRYAAFQIEVDGHTDDTKVSTPAYPSNWELSASRATMVVRLFIQNGVAPTRLEAIGFADTRPKVANTDAEGHPLPANEAVNRRVTIHVYPR